MRQHIILTLLLFVCSTGVTAQWRRLEGVHTRNIYCLLRNGSVLFAGTDCGTYRSTDNGASWSASNIGLTDSIGMSDPYVSCLARNGSVLFAGSYGVYRSTDNGASWIEPSPTLPWDRYTSSIVASNGLVFASGSTQTGLDDDSGFVYRSSDNGSTWVPSDAGLPCGSGINGLVLSGRNLVVPTGRGIYCSSDDGTSWNARNSGLPGNVSICSLFVAGQYLFASTGTRLYRSDSDGTHWSVVGTDLPKDCNVTSIISTTTCLLAGTAGRGIYRSTDDGTTWKQCAGWIQNSFTLALFNDDTGIIAGTDDGVSRSTKDGISWSHDTTGLPVNAVVENIVITPKYLFATVYRGGVFRSLNGGKTWTRIARNLPRQSVIDLVASTRYLFAGTDRTLYRSGDFGDHWEIIDTNLAFVGNRNRLMSGFGKYSTYHQIDRDGGIYFDESTADAHVSRLVCKDNTMFALRNIGGKTSVQRSKEGGMNWVSIWSPRQQIESIEAQGKHLNVRVADSGLYQFQNNGSKWIHIKDVESVDAEIVGEEFEITYTVFTFGNSMYIGTDKGIFLSNDNGEHWSKYETGMEISARDVFGLIYSNRYLYAATRNGVWRILLKK